MRPRIVLVALAAASALLAGGCGDEPTSPGTPKDGTLVRFESGGGLAAHLREMVVHDDGSALLVGTDTDSVAFQLSDQELDSLRGALEAHPAEEIDSSELAGYCADCFTYSLEYGGGKLTGDEASLSPEAQDLIGEVSALAAAHQSDPPDPEARLVRYAAASGLPFTFSELTITNSGSARLRRSDATQSADGESAVEFIVPFDEMQKLRRVLALHPADDLGPGFDPDCMDCPSLSLSYGGEKFETNDLEPNASTRAVTGALDRISTEFAPPVPDSETSG